MYCVSFFIIISFSLTDSSLINSVLRQNVFFYHFYHSMISILFLQMYFPIFKILSLIIYSIFMNSLRLLLHSSKREFFSWFLFASNIYNFFYIFFKFSSLTCFHFLHSHLIPFTYYIKLPLSLLIPSIRYLSDIQLFTLTCFKETRIPLI